ncbi:MAG: hypothetical protein ACOYXT_26215, partial [Bacteroidota bacterium]
MRSFIAILLVSSVLLTTYSGFAQTQGDLYKSFSLGILSSELGYDTGLGLEIGTPSLFKNRVSFRMRVNENWLEVYKAQYG